MNGRAAQHHAFPRAARLTCKPEFKRVFELGEKVRGYAFLCYILVDGADRPRVGLVVSRKVGNAVTRNRVKRHIREFFRLNRHRMPPGTQVVVVGRGASASMTSAACARELNRMLRSRYCNGA